MKKSRRKSIIAVGMAVCMTVVNFSGCQNNTVDYSIDDTRTEEAAQPEGASGLAQFAGADAWKEEWTGESESGNTINFSVNAAITIPDVDSMYVIEVKSPEAEEEYNERVITAVFGDTDVYYYDDVRLPKTLLQEKIMAYEDEIANKQTYIDEGMLTDSYLEYMEKEIAEEKEKLSDCKTALETAGDDYIPVEDYDSDAYRGFINGTAYILRIEWSASDVKEGIIWPTEEGMQSISGDYGSVLNEQKVLDVSLTPEDIYDVCPEEAQDARELSFCDGGMVDDFVANSCGLTEEEANSIAESALVNSGFSNPVCKGVYEITWQGDPQNLGDGITEYKLWYRDGYMLRYEFGIGDLLFPEYGVEFGYSDYDKYSTFYSTTAWADVYVTEKGVISMEVHNPIEVTMMTEDVKLLPLENIQEIIRDELMNHVEAFPFAEQTACSFHYMELIYFRISDDSKEGYYSYIPAWRLCNKEATFGFYENAVVVNAIDGSLIDLAAEFR